MLHSFFIKRKWAAVLVIVLVVLLSGAAVFSISLLNRKTFYKGISLEDTDISGLNIIQAKKALDKAIQDKYGNKKYILDAGSNTWVLTPGDLSVEFLTEQALHQAYQIGRKGNFLRRIYNIFNLQSNSININTHCQYDRSKAESILKKIKKQVDKEEKNASVKVNGTEVSFEKEVVGKELDIEKNMQIIDEFIMNKRFGRINLQVKDKIPDILYENIKDMTHVISTYSTSFNVNNHNRSYNIKLACEKINSIIVMPQKVFSMDMSLGPRTIEKGYKEAPVIFKKELIPGIGGGVCQVTTTLYVAVLKAKLGIAERSPHSLPLGYVEPGQDATIAENSIDFKFKNTTEYPVCLGAEVKGNRIIILIIGRNNQDNLTVKLKSQILEEYFPEETEYIIDNTVPRGKEVVVEKPRKGYRVAVYREVYNSSGELIEREKISEDSYKSVRGQIKVNESYFEPENTEESVFRYWYFPYPSY